MKNILHRNHVPPENIKELRYGIHVITYTSDFVKIRTAVLEMKHGDV
jgi:hypothetical protein